MPVDDEKEALFQAIRGGSCVAFVGSGPSRSAYPRWPDLVDRLCGACGVEPLTAEGREDADILLGKAEECREANEAAYCDVLTAAFGTEVYDIPRIYSQLAKLQFRSYVTTNFDPMLRTALDSIPEKCDGVYVYPDLPVQKIGRGRLFHIHGLMAPGAVLNVDRIVLAKADFERAYSHEYSMVRSFLAQLFTYNSCCFIGIGLREPELRRLFLACAAVRRKLQYDWPDLTPPRHYALLPMLYRRAGGPPGVRDLDAEAIEARTFDELGVNVVRYQPLDDRHLGLIQLLDECLELLTVPIRSGFEPENIK